MTQETPTVDDRIARDKAILLEQMTKTPVVQMACEKTQIGRTTYYRWRREDAAFAKAADEAIRDGCLLVNDIAESQLLAAIRDGDFAAVQYWLKHHHPSYAARMELKATIEQERDLTPEEEAVIRQSLKLAGLIGADAQSDSPKWP